MPMCLSQGHAHVPESRACPRAWVKGMPMCSSQGHAHVLEGSQHDQLSMYAIASFGTTVQECRFDLPKICSAKKASVAI